MGIVPVFTGDTAFYHILAEQKNIKKQKLCLSVKKLAKIQFNLRLWSIRSFWCMNQA